LKIGLLSLKIPPNFLEIRGEIVALGLFRCLDAEKRSLWSALRKRNVPVGFRAPARLRKIVSTVFRVMEHQLIQPFLNHDIVLTLLLIF